MRRAAGRQRPARPSPTGSIAGHQATDPLRQLVDRYVPAGRFQQQLLGVLAVTRPAGQSFQATRLRMGIAGQLPALPGHRRAQLDHIAASFLLPVDASAAAVLPLLTATRPWKAQSGCACSAATRAASACAASAETTSTTAGAGASACPRWYRRSPGHGRQQQRPDQGNTAAAARAARGFQDRAWPLLRRSGGPRHACPAPRALRQRGKRSPGPWPGPAQLHQCFFPATQAIQHPAIAVDDGGVVRFGHAGAVDQPSASCRRRYGRPG